MNYSASFWIYENKSVKDECSELFEAKNDKEAFEKAKALTKKLNDMKRKERSVLRYGLSCVARFMKEVTLKNMGVWLDEQTFNEWYPNKKYPE